MLRTKIWSMGLAGVAPVCGLILAAMAGTANATPTLVVTDSACSGTTTWNIAETSSGSGAFNGSVTGCGWNLNVVAALTMPASGGTANAPIMDLSLQGYTAGLGPNGTNGSYGNGTLSVQFTDDNLYNSGEVAFSTVLSQGQSKFHPDSATACSNLTASSFSDGSPASVGTGTIATIGNQCGAALVVDDSTQLLTGGPYGLTLQAVLSGSGVLSVDDSLGGAVPEPATFALFGAGLLGFALFLGGRRRRSESV